MAQLRTVPRAEWATLFGRLSEAMLGKRVQIEVASLELGDQIVAEWIPSVGITYDHNDDSLDVALDGMNHLIRRPREVAVEQGPTGVASIAVVDGDGTRQIVRLKDPVMLPPDVAIEP